MAESKMKEVAQLLGVELGEEFKIKGSDHTYKFTNCGLYNNGFRSYAELYCLLNGEYEIEKPILDKVEKKYLENILRPFKDRVLYVEKVNGVNQRQFLCITLDGLAGYENIDLPYFKENTMYIGMQAGKQYTLKESGLFE